MRRLAETVTTATRFRECPLSGALRGDSLIKVTGTRPAANARKSGLFHGVTVSPPKQMTPLSPAACAGGAWRRATRCQVSGFCSDCHHRDSSMVAATADRIGSMVEAVDCITSAISQQAGNVARPAGCGPTSMGRRQPLPTWPTRANVGAKLSPLRRKPAPFSPLIAVQHHDGPRGQELPPRLRQVVPARSDHIPYLAGSLAGYGMCSVSRPPGPIDSSHSSQRVIIPIFDRAAAKVRDRAASPRCLPSRAGRSGIGAAWRA